MALMTAQQARELSSQPIPAKDSQREFDELSEKIKEVLLMIENKISKAIAIYQTSIEVCFGFDSNVEMLPTLENSIEEALRVKGYIVKSGIIAPYESNLEISW